MKIEIRKFCKICGEPIAEKRFRTFCSKKCRLKDLYRKNGKRQAQWLRDKKDKEASIPSKDKIQCLICGRWYRRVGTHIYYRHGITAREYRQEYGFDLIKGQLSDDLKELYSKNSIKSRKNLEKGKKHQFKKGQKGIGVYARSVESLERIKAMGMANRII